MDMMQKQRAVIKFLTKEKYNAANMYKRHRNVYCGVTIDINMQMWLKSLKKLKAMFQFHLVEGKLLDTKSPKEFFLSGFDKCVERWYTTSGGHFK